MNSSQKTFLRAIRLEISRPVPKAWLASLRAAGIDAACAGDDLFRRGAGSGAKAGTSEKCAGADGHFDPATLWITDDPELARERLLRGEAVLAFCHEKNRGSFFPGVKYVCERLDELDAAYLDRVYRRYAGIPWEILETERCLLRETTIGDVDAFYRIYREPSVTAYMEDLFESREEEIAYTKDYIRNIYEFYGFGVWTVCLKETGEVIGRAGLSYREGFEEPELGFLIGVPWQGRGLAREVCRAVLTFGRKELGFEAVVAFVRPGNETSIRLLESLGFAAAGEEVLEGIRHIRYLRRESGLPAAPLSAKSTADGADFG